MSTIQEELNRLTTARDDIKGVLDRLNVSYEGDKLDMLAKAANTIQKVEATQENGIVTVPAGYISEEQTFVVGSEFSAGYLINNDDGSVYFQKVKVVDGETVNDGDPVQITGVSIPETGVAEPDYAQGGGGDVTLGQIDADGNFQPLAFDGTESSNDGDPETVDSYYGWNGTLPVPDNGIKVGEAAEYYKCASVDTTAKTWTGYKAVLTNGVYTFEETVTTGLTYGNGFTPSVGGIYSADALVIVSKLYASAGRSVITIVAPRDTGVAGTYKQVEGTEHGTKGCVWLQNPSKGYDNRGIRWGTSPGAGSYGDDDYAGVEGWHVCDREDGREHKVWLGDGDFPAAPTHWDASSILTESFEDWE